MSGDAVDLYEQAQERGRQVAAFWRAGPHEPMATRAQVLEVPCSACGAEPGAECDTSFPRPSWLGMAMPGLRGIHTRRYLDKTGDPR